MTSMQNQGLEGLNVLHDQGLPNTLGGLGPPMPVQQLRLRVGALLAVAAVILAMLAIVALLVVPSARLG
ncbi:MAG: hypothetical protein ABSD62_02030 [Candidatus Limnocylindrales bacterium]|jgi:hypothetical protein